MTTMTAPEIIQQHHLQRAADCARMGSYYAAMLWINAADDELPLTPEQYASIPHALYVFYADTTIRDADGRTIARRNQIITPALDRAIHCAYPGRDVHPYGYTVFTGEADALAHIRAENGAHFLEV